MIRARTTCPVRHRRTISKTCLREHAADRAAHHGYHSNVTHGLIDEWARSRNGILPAAQTAHRGRHGAYGEWSIAAYRRLLIALRRRESGIADVKDIRLRLRLAGHRLDDRFAIADLAHGYRQQVRSAQREMPGVADGHMRARPPLRMRREVERVVTVFRPTEYVTTLAADEERWLEELRMDPRTKPVFLAITDLMYRGPSEAVIAHLKDAATLMPRWMFEQPAQIIEATALASGALAPDRSNTVLRALHRARIEDVRMAEAFLAWLPRFLQGVQAVAEADPGPEGPFLRRMSGITTGFLAYMPFEARIALLAVLTASYVRFREGSITWAPGVITLAS